MNSKKVLFILHYPPPVHGAAMVGRYIKQSDIINNNFDCRFINSGTSVSVDEIGRGGFVKIKRYFEILAKTITTLYRHKPDLVYLTLTASGVGLYKDALIVLIIKTFSKKLVFHFHNKGVSKNPDNWFNNILYKCVLSNVEVILLSKHLYYDIAKYVSINRIHFCPNGIPERQVLKSNKYVKSNRVQILFLSNLIESKGVYILLKACQLMQSKQLPFECTFIGGEGNITVEEFEKQVQSFGVNDCVNYLGAKYGSEKEEAYNRSDIFVFPTYHDCFPLVLLEAMQYSLPLISTFEGGISDIVENGKTGFLVNQQDAESLALKLEVLILDSELRLKMGEAGRKRFEEKFTIEVFEQSFTNIISLLV